MKRSSKKTAAQWGIGIVAGVTAAMVGKAVMDSKTSFNKTMKRASKAISHIMSNVNSMM